MLMILPVMSWLHFFFSQRSEVNLFASIQAVISMYTHRSLCDIALFTPLHIASHQNMLQHPQALPDSNLMHASSPKVAAIAPKRNTSVLFHGLVTLTVAPILLPPLGKSTEQLQLWHNSLPASRVA